MHLCCPDRDVVQGLDEILKLFTAAREGEEMAYIVAKIEPFKKHPWDWKDRKPTDGIEDKYNFLRYVEELDGVVIHPGAPHN